MPYEGIIERFCASFGCLPSEAMRELRELSPRMLADILSLRAYHQTKQALDQGAEIADSPLVQMVRENQVVASREKAEQQEDEEDESWLLN